MPYRIFVHGDTSTGAIFAEHEELAVAVNDLVYGVAYDCVMLRVSDCSPVMWRSMEDLYVSSIHLTDLTNTIASKDFILLTIEELEAQPAPAVATETSSGDPVGEAEGDDVDEDEAPVIVIVDAPW